MADYDGGRHSANRGTTLVLLVAVVTLFILLVSYGWLHLLAPIVGRIVMAGALALLLTLIAVMLARYIGGQRAAGLIEDGEARPRLIDWLLLYPFLFLISALGTMNTAFYRFEGASVLQGDIDTAQLKLRQLESAAAELMGDRTYEARQQRLNVLLAALKPEITDSTRGDDLCGVGTNALTILEEIKALLPGFRIPNGIVGRTRCSEIDEQAIYDGLERQARQILDAGIDPILSGIRTEIATAQAKLQKAETGLEIAESGNLDENAYFVAQDALREAATTYTDARERAVGRLGADAEPKLPQETRLDVGRSLNLGSVFSLLPTLWTRIGYGTTWVYIVAAVALDVALVFLFMSVALATRSFNPPRVRAASADPQFLWVNPAR